MATFVKVNDFVHDLGQEVHNLGSDSIRIALSNTAPASESPNPTADGNGVLANVTQISYANYTDDLATDRVLESVTWTLSSGTATLDAGDFTITASGGAIADWRYAYIYNDTATGDALIGVQDEGETISLSDGQSHAITINASGLLSIS